MRLRRASFIYAQVEGLHVFFWGLLHHVKYHRDLDNMPGLVNPERKAERVFKGVGLLLSEERSIATYRDVQDSGKRLAPVRQVVQLQVVHDDVPEEHPGQHPGLIHAQPFKYGAHSECPDHTVDEQQKVVMLLPHAKELSLEWVVKYGVC